MEIEKYLYSEQSELCVVGQLTQGPNVPIPGTKYKRSNSILVVTSIALIYGRVWPQLLRPPAQSQIGSPGTLSPTSLGTGLIRTSKRQGTWPH